MTETARVRFECFTKYDIIWWDTFRPYMTHAVQLVVLSKALSY
jgi:hypothetical protein